MTYPHSYPEIERLRHVLGAFYKTVDVMKSARNGKKPMEVWADDMKAVEDVMLLLEGLRDAPAIAQRPIIAVKPMALSDDRTDYFVSISVDDREITPYVFRDEQFKAEYEAASFRWLLLGEAKPDLMAYSEGGWPDSADATQSVPSTLHDGACDIYGHKEDDSELASGKDGPRSAEPPAANPSRGGGAGNTAQPPALSSTQENTP